MRKILGIVVIGWFGGLVVLFFLGASLNADEKKETTVFFATVFDLPNFAQPAGAVIAILESHCRNATDQGAEVGRVIKEPAIVIVRNTPIPVINIVCLLKKRPVGMFTEEGED